MPSTDGIAPSVRGLSDPERPLRIVLVASLTSSLVNFRLELIRSLVRSGVEVFAIGPEEDPDTLFELARLGVHFRRVPMERAGTSPAADLKTLRGLLRAFREIRPDIVLPYTMKPVVYGGISARLSGISQRYALITGLGYVFTDRAPSLKGRLLRGFSVALYRLALAGADRVFAYNSADAHFLARNRIIGEERITVVPGSGVDLLHFTAAPPPGGPPVFLMIARLLRDKGVTEYVEAAGRVKARHPEARFQLLGPFDPNPAAISEREVADWVSGGAIEYLGETRDVRPFLTACTVFVLPSYREGIPRAVLEAMATGRAVVVSDAPGCRDAIENGVTGLAVPVRDAPALVQAMERFIEEPELAAAMGAQGRRRAEETYDVRAVNRLLLREMGIAPMRSALGPADETLFKGAV